MQKTIKVVIIDAEEPFIIQGKEWWDWFMDRGILIAFWRFRAPRKGIGDGDILYPLTHQLGDSISLAAFMARFKVLPDEILWVSNRADGIREAIAHGYNVLDISINNTVDRSKIASAIKNLQGDGH